MKRRTPPTQEELDQVHLMRSHLRRLGIIMLKTENRKENIGWSAELLLVRSLNEEGHRL